jgi:hypothetical protein
VISLRAAVVLAGPEMTKVDLVDLWQRGDLPGPIYVWIETAKINEPQKTPALPPKVPE